MIYCYLCPACGHTEDVMKPMSKVDRPELCPKDQFVMVRDFGAEAGSHKPGNWPMTSVAAGVAPDQAVEAAVDASAMGVPTEFNSQGDAVFTSAKHRKDFCRAYGMHDRNGGYSDP